MDELDSTNPKHRSWLDIAGIVNSNYDKTYLTSHMGKSCD